MKDNSTVIFSSDITYVGQKESIKVQIFETSECSGLNRQFIMSVLKGEVNSFSSFESFFIVMMHNSSENVKLIHFLSH